MPSHNPLDREQAMALVNASPEAVAAHDKTAWLNLFAAVHVVEDPVGSAPHIGGLPDAMSGLRGNGALSRFYDTFIAPNDIRFHVQHDFVCGMHVVRDLDIEIAMSPEVTVRVPMHLLYQLVEEQQGLRIQRLAAHWELAPMSLSLMKPDAAHLKVVWANNLRLIHHLGWRGMAGFSRAFFNVGQRGKQLAIKLLDALQRGDSETVLQSRAVFSFAGRDALTNDDAVAHLRGMQCGKMLVAGDVVSVSVTLGNGEPAVLFVHFGRKPFLHVVNVVIYCNSEGLPV